MSLLRPYDFIIYGITAIGQFTMTYKLFKNTSKIKEVGNLPKIMTAIANVPSIALIVQKIWFDNKIIRILMFSLFIVSLIFNLSQWMRFFRIQVQLKAEKENTRLIIKAIRRSEASKKFYIVLFSIIIAMWITDSILRL